MLDHMDYYTVRRTVRYYTVLLSSYRMPDRSSHALKDIALSILVTSIGLHMFGLPTPTLT